MPAAALKSDQTSTRLVAGDTVQVLVEVPVSSTDNLLWSDLLMPAKTVFRYVGPDVAGSVNAASIRPVDADWLDPGYRRMRES